jgi:hypothetical protein
VCDTSALGVDREVVSALRAIESEISGLKHWIPDNSDKVDALIAEVGRANELLADPRRAEAHMNGRATHLLGWGQGKLTECFSGSSVTPAGNDID